MDAVFEPVESVIVVGGGDAGLLAALLVNAKNSETKITVIDDFEDDIPSVGKSTYTPIIDILHNTLKIDGDRFIEEVQPVWKGSVYFEDWCGLDPFHFPFDDRTISTGGRKEQFDEFYYRYQTRAEKTVDTELVEQRKTPFTETPTGLEQYHPIAYHLDLSRFNPFLREVCQERGIHLVDDEITAVQTDNQTRITTVNSQDTEYTADLYIDATGFNRSLISELQHDFNELEMPLDSAVTGQAEIALGEITPATVIRTGDNGWFWQIDTTNNRDLGYVYSSAHCSQDEATTEFLEYFDSESGLVEDTLRHYSFNSGAVNEPWVGNCLAVGNAGGFIEPLQSTTLTQTTLLTRKAMELLSQNRFHNTAGVRDVYNTHAQDAWENVHQFVLMHYAFAPGDSDFWKDIRSRVNPSEIAWYQNYQSSGNAMLQDAAVTNAGATTEPFIIPQKGFSFMLQCLNVDCEFYEELDIEVPQHVKDMVDDHERVVEKQVRENHLSYPEYYRQKSV
jgi:tryptophan halogenase